MKDYQFLSQALISIEDIKKETNTDSNLYYVIKRLVDTNKIKKLKSGLYATINPLTKDIFANKYEIATAIYCDCVVGYHSALEYHGLANQVYYDVQVITNRNYSPVVVEDLEYSFYRNDYADGILEIEQNGRILVTDLERTIVDCVDRVSVAGGLEEVFTAMMSLNYCDEKKILKYLKDYGKKFLYKKVGYLFSIIKPYYLSKDFYSVCKENMSKREDDIRENIKLPSAYIKEWELYVPKQIVNMEN